MDILKCPNCNNVIRTTFIDIGVGMLQSEPYYCYSCGWIQPCPYQETCTPKCVSFDICKNKKGETMERSNEMQKFVDDFTKDSFGKTHTECQEESVCVTCHKPITNFRNEISRKEYGISGMCQDCQDSVFGKD